MAAHLKKSKLPLVSLKYTRNQMRYSAQGTINNLHCNPKYNVMFMTEACFPKVSSRYTQSWLLSKIVIECFGYYNVSNNHAKSSFMLVVSDISNLLILHSPAPCPRVLRIYSFNTV